MSTAVHERVLRPRKLAILWLVPVQAAGLFTVWAINSGGQALRAWILTALLWLMTLPLLLSLEASLIAMMLFEPFRGLIRRAQYLIISYSGMDPIHLLTPVVTMMALAVLLKKQRLNILLATPLAGSVSVLGLIFFVEIFNPLQGSLFVGLTGALFMLVPLVWFYFGQAVSENFVEMALRLIVILGILASLYGLYQLTFGYPRFEQYWIDNTDMYSSIAIGHVTRALATFSSAEEWGRYTQIGVAAALGFAIAAKRFALRLGWLLCALASLGAVMLSGQRTAIFGVIVSVGTMILLGAQNLRAVFARMAMLMLPVVLALVFASAPTNEDVWSKDDSQTVGTLLSHTKRGTLKPGAEDSLQIRLENWAYVVTSVIPYRPLGAGLGAGSLSDLRENRGADSRPIDNFVLVLAVACGIPGALLFVWILSRATWFSVRLARAPAGESNTGVRRIVASIMPALILNSIFGLTFTIYSVAPVAWLLIGWISAETLKARRDDAREILVI